MSLERMNNPEYMGDGVYLADDGYQIWLSTDVNNYMIALDPQVMANVMMQGYRIWGNEVWAKILQQSTKHLRERIAAEKGEADD